MTLANVLTWLNGSEFPLPQLRASLSNGFSLRCLLREIHEQTVAKLVASFVAVDVWHNHFDCPSAIKLLDKRSSLRSYGIGIRLKSPQRAGGFVEALKPRAGFATILLFQKR